ncbi:MAG: hypothetical protein KGI26_02455 [Thaumarchaeota archaeon]|nr:hypothetical protein [Nitrososphaerota archaeon]
MLRFLIGAVALLLVLQATSAAAVSPPYASAGAFASYTAQGGFIAYFSGVVGNITYSVAEVFGNGSMALHIFENITAGTDLNPFITTINVTDSVSNPAVFPAVPLSNLSTGHIRFQNVTASFLKNGTASVPAGTFQTIEFTGNGTGGDSVHIWFDRNTGLMVEENSGTSAVELESTNVAIAYGPPGGFNGELAYELVFVFAFVIGGGLFLYMRYYYTRSAQAKKDATNGRK